MKKIKSKKKISKILIPAFIGTIVLGTIGIGGAIYATEKNRGSGLNLETTSLGLPVHLKAGEYNLVATKEFVDKIDSLQQQQRAQAYMDNIKFAISQFNEQSQNIKFNFFAVNEKLSRYGVRQNAKTDNIITFNLMSDSKSDLVYDVAKNCSWNGLIENAEITLNFSKAVDFWDYYGDKAKFYSSDNSVLVTITEKALMKTIGFVDEVGENKNNTITRVNIAKDIKSYTNYDKWAIAQYNHAFTGAPEPSHQKLETKTANYALDGIEEFGM